MVQCSTGCLADVDVLNFFNGRHTSTRTRFTIILYGFHSSIISFNIKVRTHLKLKYTFMNQFCVRVLTHFDTCIWHIFELYFPVLVMVPLPDITPGNGDCYLIRNSNIICVLQM